MSTASLAFSTQLIGRTEKALNAILGRLLADSGLSEPEWVALSVALSADAPLDRQELTSRVAGALKVEDVDAYPHVAGLSERGFLDLGRDPVGVTDKGREFRESIAGVVAEITDRLWGDLAQEELDVAAYVLNTVLSRVEDELTRL